MRAVSHATSRASPARRASRTTNTPRGRLELVRSPRRPLSHHDVKPRPPPSALKSPRRRKSSGAHPADLREVVRRPRLPRARGGLLCPKPVWIQLLSQMVHAGQEQCWVWCHFRRRPIPRPQGPLGPRPAPAPVADNALWPQARLVELHLGKLGAEASGPSLPAPLLCAPKPARKRRATTFGVAHERAAAALLVRSGALSSPNASRAHCCIFAGARAGENGTRSRSWRPGLRVIVRISWARPSFKKWVYPRSR